MHYAIIETVETITDPNMTIAKDHLNPDFMDHRFDERQCVYKNEELNNSKKRKMIIRSDDIIKRHSLRKFRKAIIDAESEWPANSGICFKEALKKLYVFDDLLEINVKREGPTVVLLFTVLE